MKGINPSNSEIETYYKDLSDYFKYHNFKITKSCEKAKEIKVNQNAESI
jgi:hypothetical protein